jgi:hypothetical protein
MMTTVMMLKMTYWCDVFGDQLPQPFTLLNNEVEEVVYIYSGFTFVGAIHHNHYNWQQIGGEEMPKKIIEEIGLYIQRKQGI